MNNLSELQNPPSQVQQYYYDKTIFLTGGTGFLGKLLIEKILRSCFQVRKIYLLIREKYGKSAQERIMDLYDDEIFNLCKSQILNFKNLFTQKIEAVIGDSSYKDLIFDSQSRQKVKDETQILVSFAATLSFHSPLDIAIRDNYLSAIYSLEFAQQSELGIKKRRGSLRVIITRSALVSGPIQEPIPGWTQIGQGASKIQYLIASGLLQGLAAEENSVSFIIPGDIVINAVIAQMALKSNENTLQILNLCTSSINPLTWGQFARDSIQTLKNLGFCTDNSYSQPDFLSKSQFLDLCKEMKKQTQTASREEQFYYKKMLRIYVSYYKKYQEVTSSLSQIDSKNYVKLAESLNEADKKLFYCDARQINWKIHLQDCMKGALKEYEGKKVILQKL